MTQLSLDVDVYHPIPGLRFGRFARHPGIFGETSYYHLVETDHPETAAGTIYCDRDGEMLVVVNLGCKITGPNSGGSNSLRIPLGKVDYATAERRLLDEAIAARSNPSLLWSHVVTPAAKRIAMANGWWKHEQGEAA